MPTKKEKKKCQRAVGETEDADDDYTQEQEPEPE